MRAQAPEFEAGLRSSLWASFATVVTSSGTLVCCALPALLVSIGAGATLAGLVTAVPQLVWLSAHKVWVFGGAGVMLGLAGWLQWRARFLPCPADAALARACARTRRVGVWVYASSVVMFAVGALFAFILPRVV